jgi:hypothetical protein
MGTWNEGILENDTAADGLAALQSSVVSDITELGAGPATPTSTATLGAAVGVLLQLSAYEFGLDTDSGPEIVKALKAHAAQIAVLPTAARMVLERVMAGEGTAIAEQPAKVPASHLKLLYSGGTTRSPFGARQASLFTGSVGKKYVQKVAKRCIEAVDEAFDDEDNWCDLCREAEGIGTLAALLVIEPCKVPAAKIDAWRKKAKKGLAVLEADPDEELDFHQKYYANLDKLFGVLRDRFVTK